MERIDIFYDDMSDDNDGAGSDEMEQLVAEVARVDVAVEVHLRPRAFVEAKETPFDSVIQARPQWLTTPSPLFCDQL